MDIYIDKINKMMIISLNQKVKDENVIKKVREGIKSTNEDYRIMVFDEVNNIIEF
ncbi:hypothetical protein [Staphylococcus equorum]|uniref:Uncharacterized protein n=1 Tax=Staphylococcus equorum TaxID=246432 RepID=A0A9X4LC99_9STAP|nr:hypothetical protein [Staphylococcus equorum]MDG0860359.1 hypothetical protein [Staphylococcus equorum]